jgi:hypothetical protein
MNIEHPIEFQIATWYYHRKQPRLAIVWPVASPSNASAAHLFYAVKIAHEISKIEAVRPKEVFVFTISPFPNELLIRFQEHGIPVFFHTLTSFNAEEFEEVKQNLNNRISYFSSGSDLSVWVKGDYPVGSAGDAHGKTIYYAICMLAEIYEPSRILVDLKELEYTWGDALSIRPPEFIFANSRIGIIINPEQKESFSYIMRDDLIFFSWEKAKEAV